MNTLSETWFIEGNIDFESKKYTLLAYLQKISNFFGEKKLYPQLSEVIFHYNNLMTFKQNKRLLQSRFPRRLTGIQLQRLKMLYEEMIADDELMSEIEQITLFATRKMKDTIAGGTDLYDYVENILNITPVGILPLELDEGYFFLCDGYFSSIRVYQYRLSIIERSDDKYRTLRSQHISDWYTFSHIIHGFIFYGLARLAFPRWSLAARLTVATFVDGSWEIFENTDFVINRYREATISLDYYGDSVLNSVCDILAMVAGFFLARRLPVWVTVALAVFFELFTGYMIRDNLALNIVMLLWPLDAIKTWQAGG